MLRGQPVKPLCEPPGQLHGLGGGGAFGAIYSLPFVSVVRFFFTRTYSYGPKSLCSRTSSTASPHPSDVLAIEPSSYRVAKMRSGGVGFFTLALLRRLHKA